MSLGLPPAGSTPSEEWGHKVLAAVDGALEEVGATASTGGYVEAKPDSAARINASDSSGVVVGNGPETIHNARPLAQDLDLSISHSHLGQITARSSNALSGREQAASQLSDILSRQKESSSQPEVRDTPEVDPTVSVSVPLVTIIPMPAVLSSGEVESVAKALATSGKQQNATTMPPAGSVIPKKPLPDLMPARHLPVDTPMIEHLPGGWIGSADSGDSLKPRSTVMQDVVAGLDSVGHLAYNAIPQTVKESINPNRPGPSFIDRAQTYVEGVHIPQAPHIELPELPNVQLPSLPEMHLPAFPYPNKDKNDSRRQDDFSTTPAVTQRYDSPEDVEHIKRIASDILSGARSPAEQAYYDSRSTSFVPMESGVHQEQGHASASSQPSSPSEQSEDQSGLAVNTAPHLQQQAVALGNLPQDRKRSVTSSFTSDVTNSLPRTDAESDLLSAPIDASDKTWPKAPFDADENDSGTGHNHSPSVVDRLRADAEAGYAITAQPDSQSIGWKSAPVSKSIETSTPLLNRADQSTSSHLLADLAPPLELVVENDPIFEGTQQARIGNYTQPASAAILESQLDTSSHQFSGNSLEAVPTSTSDASIASADPSHAVITTNAINAPSNPPLGKLDHPSADRTDSSASITAVKHGHLGHAQSHGPTLATVSEKSDYREQPAIDSALPSQKSPSVEDFSTTKARPEPAPKPVLSGRQAETSRDTRGPTVSTISQPTRTNLESAHTRTDSEVSTSSKKKGFLSKLKDKLHHDK